MTSERVHVNGSAGCWIMSFILDCATLLGSVGRYIFSLISSFSFSLSFWILITCMCVIIIEKSFALDCCVFILTYVTSYMYIIIFLLL